MRYLAVIAIVVPIIVGGYLLARMPRSETAAQIVAREAVDSLTRARIEAFGHGDFELWGQALRSDARVMPSCPTRVLGPAAAIAEMKEDFGHYLGEQLILPVRVNRVATGATRRGRFAWAAAEMAYRTNWAEAEGENREYSLRHCAAFLLQDGEWRAVLEHDSYALSWDEMRGWAAARRDSMPAALPAPEGRAERLARRFERWLPDFSGRRVDGEAIAVGPTGAIAVGDSAVKAMLADWKGRLGEARIVPGGLAAWAPRGRGVGWVAANLEVTPPGWSGATLPLRLTCVYRATGEDSWRLVLAHLSVGVPDDGPGPLAEEEPREHRAHDHALAARR